jgi:hypothetical protein
MRIGLMKRREIVDLLADHADALNADADVDGDAACLANSASLTAVSSVLTLLHLAQAVQRVMVPVTLSPSFQMELKDQLEQLELTIEEERPFPTTIVLGTAVSVIGLTLYLLRRSRAAGGGVVTAV